MEYRKLGNSGLKVSALSYGTATFGGNNEFFRAWGTTDLAEARRLIGICLDAGVNMVDTADCYSNGLSEEILSEALKGNRDKVYISTKGSSPMGGGPNDSGSSRSHLIKSCEDSLRRLKTDHIDLYYMHEFDATTPVEETLRALDDLVTSGKACYIGCSNFSGWHLMKSLSISERFGWAKYVVHQLNYSLCTREFEWELMPLAVDQKVGTTVWSPLSGGALSGKIRRNQSVDEDSRIKKLPYGLPTTEEHLFKIVDTLYELSAETGKTVAQIALNWCLQRPTVSSVIIGARKEEQLRDNLGAVGWNLTEEQIAKLDASSKTQPVYPYCHQQMFPFTQTPLRG